MQKHRAECQGACEVSPVFGLVKDQLLLLQEKVHFRSRGVCKHTVSSLQTWGNPVATWELCKDVASYPHSLFYSSGACTLGDTGTGSHPLC